MMLNCASYKWKVYMDTWWCPGTVYCSFGYKERKFRILQDLYFFFRTEYLFSLILFFYRNELAVFFMKILTIKSFHKNTFLLSRSFLLFSGINFCSPFFFFHFSCNGDAGFKAVRLCFIFSFLDRGGQKLFFCSNLVTFSFFLVYILIFY